MITEQKLSMRVTPARALFLEVPNRPSEEIPDEKRSGIRMLSVFLVFEPSPSERDVRTVCRMKMIRQRSEIATQPRQRSTLVDDHTENSTLSASLLDELPPAPRDHDLPHKVQKDAMYRFWMSFP